ncbi:MAG: transketolase [Alphaproteobacteria bacterium]|nr:transketolase [Alphaproteobacteria bacterium]
MHQHPHPSEQESSFLKEAATALRFLAADAVEKAKSGHPGMPMGMADVATVLFTKFLKINPHDPLWPDRDRFVLSAGHGSMLLYGLNYLSGYKEISLETLKSFRSLGSLAAGHPEYHPTAGIETTTGPLGQGLATAVGMALGEKLLAQEFPDTLMSHHTYVIAGDGCLMEGISQEAITLAGHLNLSRLIVLFDDNHISIDGGTDLSTSEDTLARFEAAGWQAERIDGHDFAQIEAALARAQTATKPTLIACRTTIGKGAPKKQGTSDTHGSPLGAAEIEAAREALGWHHAPFEIPQSLVQHWQKKLTDRVFPVYHAWQDRFEKMDARLKKNFSDRMSGTLAPSWTQALDALKDQFLEDKPSLATRQSSGKVLDVLVPTLPELLGGSADLTGSNNTLAKGMKGVTPQDFSGRYLHYGIREHAMAAAMNGLALHGGFVPYSGTFLVFSDYCRPAIRLAALMKQRVIHVMTHDSIGLGEDGPTHQPIEHLSSLRAIPGLQVLRPADCLEAADCWEMALTYQGPSVMALTRQALPTLRREKENLSQKGAYILEEATKDHKVTLIATGSEVSIAAAVRAALEEKGIGTRLVSMPCTLRFDQTSKAYRTSVLAPHTLRVAIEAASSWGWERYVGEDGLIFGIDTFGASAPYQDLYAHFGLTAPAITDAVTSYLASTA